VARCAELEQARVNTAVVASRLLIALTTLTAGVLVPISVANALVKQPTGISLSPFQKQLTIEPSDTEKSYELLLTNHTQNLQELGLQVRDFGSLNDTGGVLLEGSTQYSQKYGLVSWLTLGTNTVVLQPGESRSIPITVQNRSSLQPGGHYGAVVASVNSLDETKKNKVLINQQLLSLLFVKKTGGDHYDLKLSSIEHNGNWLHLPSDIKLRFQNPGNTHVVPRGIVQLKSPSGKVLAQGPINTESAFVLPETFREIYVPLTKMANGPPVPGLYRIEVAYRYDGLSQSVTHRQTLNFISLQTYIAIGLLLILSVYIFRRSQRGKK
jgi:hypothetical protein